MITDISINVHYRAPKYKTYRDGNSTFWYQDIKPPRFYWGAHVDHSRMVWFGDGPLPWVDVPEEERDIRIKRVVRLIRAPACCAMYFGGAQLVWVISRIMAVLAHYDFNSNLYQIEVSCPHRGVGETFLADVEVFDC